MSVSASECPDEILVKILQYSTLQERISVFSRVCRKWRRVCEKGLLWNVIDIPPQFATNRFIAKILKGYASPYCKVLRIRFYHPNECPKGNKVKPITVNMWENIWKSCPNLSELYIDKADLVNMKNIWMLPNSIQRIYIHNCYNPHRDTGIAQMLTNSVRHSNLELLSTHHTPYFISRHQSDLRALSQNRTLTQLDLSNTIKVLDADYFRKAVVMMTQLTHLDISDGVRGLYSDDLSTMLHYLTKLKALDISTNTIDTRNRMDFGEVWKEIWANKAPNIEYVRICMLHFRDRGLRFCQPFFRIDEPFKPFVDRLDVKVYACQVCNPNDHSCNVVSLLSPPCTHIPL